MELNRNHYFMAGLVLLLVGVQFRIVESFVLNNRVTAYLIDMKGKVSTDAPNPIQEFLPSIGPPPKKVVRPPAWVGWAAMSFGAVLVLHSFAMPRPAT